MRHAPPTVQASLRRPLRELPWAALSLLGLAALPVAPVTAAAVTGSDAPPLFASVEPGNVAGAARSAPADPTEISSRAVRVDLDLLESVPAALLLDLGEGSGDGTPGAAPAVARRIAVDHHPEDGGWLTWRGSFDGDDGTTDPAGGEVLLTLHRERVAGRILTPGGELWQLVPGAGGGHRLVRLDESAFPPCGGAVEPAPILAPLPSPLWAPLEEPIPAPAPARGTEIGLLVLYTPAARSEAGGSGTIEALIRHGVDQLNHATANSGNNVRFLLHRSEEYAAPYTSESFALGPLASDPAVAAMRNQASADVVTMVIGRGEPAAEGLCGVAFGMSRNRVGPAMAPLAYNIVIRDCTATLTFAHEVGHTMGAQHEPGPNSAPPEQASFPWSFGHVVDGSFRTVMSYPTSCANGSGSCPRRTFFSNPERSHAGHPTGVADERDVRRTFAGTAGFVSAFRGGPPPSSGPEAPADLAAVALTHTDVSLSWSDRSDDEVDFEIQVQPPDEPFRQIAIAPAGAGSLVLDDLEADTAYRFRVRARNGAGASGFSNEAEVVTPPAPPADFFVLQEDETTVRLTWTVPSEELSWQAELRSPAAEPVLATPVPQPPTPAGGLDFFFLDGLEPDTPYTVRVRAIGAGGASAWSAEASVTTRGAGGPCVESDEVLCLLGGRFEARARWRNPHQAGDHGVGHAQPIPGSDRTGAFWFFAPDNVELLVKQLDGRPVNGRFWHLYGALTDVEYWVLVRDTVNPAARTYHNPPFEICGRADDDAFGDGGGAAPNGASSPGPSLAGATAGGLRAARIPVAAEPAAGTAGGACEPGPTRLCLLGGRFQVEVDWVNPRIEGDAGPGRRAEGIGTDRTGYFWFFREDNLELAVKALDGRAVNGHFWLFWAGLSDVEYTLRVTDTETGAETEHVNPAFSLCGGADTDTL